MRIYSSTIFVTLNLLANQSCTGTGIRHPQGLELLQQNFNLRRTNTQALLQLHRFGKTLTEAALRPIFLVRHGDKASVYPGYDVSRFGNNPELTSCGHKQADMVSDVLLEKAGNISAVVSSPFVRCLQTALPLAKATGKSIRVEPVLSEDRENGPYQPQNSRPTLAGELDWMKLIDLWDRTYSAPPIPTPEGDLEYWDRVEMAPAVLKNHVKMNASQGGAVVFFSHTDTSFSLAFGLCRRLFNNSAESFVRHYVEAHGAEGIQITGIIRILLDADNECVSIDPPDNQVYHRTKCGVTLPHTTPYSEDPGKYWRPPPGTPIPDARDKNFD